MAEYKQSGAASVVAWVALVLAIAGIIFAWTAYNRAGENLETQIQEGIEEALDTNDVAPIEEEDEEEPATNDNGLFNGDDEENNNDENNNLTE